MKSRKYETWCGEKQEWEDDPILIDRGGNIFHFINNRLMPLKSDTHRVCEYIGIFAEGHIELKEGDIVKRRSGEDYVVRFDQDEAKYQIERVGDNYPVDFMELNLFKETLKIIGHECEPIRKR